MRESFNIVGSLRFYSLFLQHQWMLTSAPGSVFRLTCSSCPPVNLTVSVTSRQPSWTGQTTQHAFSQMHSTLQYTGASEHDHWRAVCLFYPAERPIWRCASPSLWHVTLETRTTWLRLMVRSQSNISLFPGFWHLLFLQFKGQPSCLPPLHSTK